MLTKVVRWLSLIAFLLALAWVFSAPEFESVITAVILLIAVLSTALVSQPSESKNVEAPLVRTESDSGLLLEDHSAQDSIVVLPFLNLSPDPDTGEV